MKISPLISVIIPTYNRSRTIYRAISSVLKQDYNGIIELIIVDDCSSDDTQKLLENYDFWNFPKTIIVNSKRKWPGESRNEGIRMARWDYIALLDSDDEWILENKITLQVDFLEHNPSYWFVWTGWNVLGHGVDKNNFIFNNDDDFRNIALRHYPVHTSSWMFRKNIFSRIGGFWQNCNEDYEFILRIWTVTKCYCLPIITENYHTSVNGDYQSKIFSSWLTSIFVIWIYRKKYPFFLKSFLSRIVRWISKAGLFLRIYWRRLFLP